MTVVCHDEWEVAHELLLVSMEKKMQLQLNHSISSFDVRISVLISFEFFAEISILRATQYLSEFEFRYIYILRVHLFSPAKSTDCIRDEKLDGNRMEFFPLFLFAVNRFS